MMLFGRGRRRDRRHHCVSPEPATPGRTDGRTDGRTVCPLPAATRRRHTTTPSPPPTVSIVAAAVVDLNICTCLSPCVPPRPGLIRGRGSVTGRIDVFSCTYFRRLV